MTLLLNILAGAMVVGIFLAIRHIFRPKKPFKMKKLLLFAALLALVSCSKSGGSMDPPEPPPAQLVTVKFYSTNMVTATKVILIKVSGRDYGPLQYSQNRPACSATGFAEISLAPGNYQADYMDPSNVYASRQVAFTVPQSVTTCAFFDLK